MTVAITYTEKSKGHERLLGQSAEQASVLVTEIWTVGAVASGVAMNLGF